MIGQSQSSSEVGELGLPHYPYAKFDTVQKHRINKLKTRMSYLRWSFSIFLLCNGHL